MDSTRGMDLLDPSLEKVKDLEGVTLASKSIGFVTVVQGLHILVEELEYCGALDVVGI